MRRRLTSSQKPCPIGEGCGLPSELGFPVPEIECLLSRLGYEDLGAWFRRCSLQHLVAQRVSKSGSREY